MATLSLKKAKQLAAEKPTQDLIGKFAVMRHARHMHSIKFTCVHDTLEVAFKEAKRLSNVAPTERFLVLQVVSHVDWVA